LESSIPAPAARHKLAQRVSAGNPAPIFFPERRRRGTVHPVATVTIIVGARSREKWGVLPVDFFERRAKNLPHDINDDDF